MRIGEVVGTVTLSRVHPALSGGRLKLVVPLSLADLAGEGDKSAGEFAVFDELGAGIGSLIAISEGVEAAMPFYPNLIPIDAYNAAILDHVEIDPTVLTEGS
jgi:ethanolamine utilization protein EutN